MAETRVLRIHAYAERLTVPWWGWPAGVIVAGLVAAEIFFVLSAPVAAAVVVVAVLALVIAFLAWLSRVRIGVRPGDGGTEFWADDAHVDATLFTAAEPLDRASLYAEIGPDLHPHAFVIHRPWIASGLRLTLDDPNDPTPYWIVATRHPRRLAAALGLDRETANPDTERT